VLLSKTQEANMELEELREEVAEELMKEDKERWLSFLALTTVLLAVCATLSSFKEGNNSVDTVLNQTQAANQWAYFQAKSVKGYLYEMQKEKLEMDLRGFGPSTPKELPAEYERKIAEYAKTLARYEQEKKDIAADAKKFENLRDEAQARQDAYGIAVIFLQMGILMSSISALMRKKWLWYLGCAVGVVGVGFFFNGIFLFTK
jgi:hypothetical protein